MLIFPELLSDFTELLKSVPFPPGYDIVYPVDSGWYVMEDGRWGRDHFFPIEGTLEVEGQAFCAWVGVWLEERNTGSELERASWDFIIGFPNRRTYLEVYDEGTQVHVSNLINTASLGDPSGLAGWYSNC